ncbi:anhydro-N-acetylmuramic acid kinase [Mycoplasmopsis gallinacea]|uniref:Anhydro-N-acetylmuramic acid kinase n=1 Tax=Mycoplasmopsis gallinacea TaxID=29556 RepID=A0A6H0V680_9BACT|nr:anhydro-N-acetylmuramic acid kinase [Mycoplasmopsis gallinacea]QIW62483.1 anhydro-N-acetylmuramic acid kinase [Mycoplasmopsis gallinacea]
MARKINAIGLMCGTSVDALDVAYISIWSFDGQIKIELNNFEMFPIETNLREKIFKSFKDDISSRFLCSLNFEIANFYAKCINQFIKKHKIDKKDVNFIASHGQTIYHLIDPSESETKSTMQLGDISVIAQKTQITTIGDFRPADMANGGQGAPLVTIFDWKICKDPNKVNLLQNIGGISNVTVLNHNFEDVFAFDNGPGNVLIDYAAQILFNKPYDAGGEFAASGTVKNEIINYLLNDPYYKIKPPKSTGREKYTKAFIEKLIADFPNYNKYDLIRSLTYFTALTIANSYKDFVFKKNKKYQVFISGGGGHNKVLMKHLQDLIPDVKVNLIDELGINSDAKEAMAFAILGYLTYSKKPSNVPSATGAKRPAILGKIAPY